MIIFKQIETFITKIKKVSNNIILDNETKFLDKLGK